MLEVSLFFFSSYFFVFLSISFSSIIYPSIHLLPLALTTDGMLLFMLVLISRYLSVRCIHIVYECTLLALADNLALYPFVWLQTTTWQLPKYRTQRFKMVQTNGWILCFQSFFFVSLFLCLSAPRWEAKGMWEVWPTRVLQWDIQNIWML